MRKRLQILGNCKSASPKHYNLWIHVLVRCPRPGNSLSGQENFLKAGPTGWQISRGQCVLSVPKEPLGLKPRNFLLQSLMFCLSTYMSRQTLVSEADWLKKLKQNINFSWLSLSNYVFAQPVQKYTFKLYRKV